MAMAKAIPVERGCGRRQSGGVYFEAGLSSDGMPVEYFLIDPPIIVPDAFSLKPRGVMAYEKDGVTHVVDWVGSQWYKNCADFIEEVRRYGLSRRIPKNFPFDRLTPQSRILLAHSRAHIENAKDYISYACPKGVHNADDYEGMCCGLFWEDVEGGEPTEVERQVWRKMPAFTYTARRRPDGVKPQYKLAFFARFPCSRLVVINGEGDDEAYEKASAAQVPVEREDE